MPLEKKENGKTRSFQYIPLANLLQKIAGNEEVWAALNQPTPATHDDDILEDFTDGELFRTNPNLASQSLRLHFYVDEFEVVNPLGSSKGTHKLTAVYFKLGNLGNKENSQLHNTYPR